MSRLRLVLSEAGRSIGANLSTSFAATMTVLIGMFLLGVLVALGTWIVSWSDHVKDQLQVDVFLCTPDAPGCAGEVTPKQVRAVRIYLAEQKQAGVVKEYQFVSKSEALAIMRKREPEFVKLLSSNPLPAKYQVKPVDAANLKQLAADLRAQRFAGVEQVKDGKQTSSRILKVSRVIEIAFTVAVAVLLVASVLLIANTIRLSIFARRREIEVMKLVGATNWFVRGPFMIEGLICGALGAIAAIILLVIGKETVLGRIDTLNTTPDVKALQFELIALILVGVGLVVGALGSGLTLRRYLRV
jgi:cell division transport system permease protein